MADLMTRTQILHKFSVHVRQAFKAYASIIDIHEYNPQKSGELDNCGFVMIGTRFGFEVFTKHGFVSIAPFNWPTRSPKSYADVLRSGVPKKWWTVSHPDTPVNMTPYIKENFMLAVGKNDGIELPDPAYLLEQCLHGNASHLALLKCMCDSDVFMYEEFVKLAVAETTNKMKLKRKLIW